MIMAQFTIAVELLLLQEGGYNPKDAGNAGCANFGITQRWMYNLVYPLLTWENAGHAVKSLSRSQAITLYKIHMWDRYSMGGIQNQTVTNALLNAMVNMGEQTAVKILQRVLKVKADGVIGPITLTTLNRSAPQDLLPLWKITLANRYRAIAAKKPGSPLKSWLRRLDRIFAS